MKFTLQLFLLLLFTIGSCRQKNESKLQEFEKILGIEKSKILTELTEDFENNYLNKKYPSLTLEQQYLKFMGDLESMNYPERSEVISEENDRKYKGSGLIFEKYWYPDSVWIDGQFLKKRWSYKDENGITHTSVSEQSYRKNRSIDSIVTLESKIPDFNSYGNFKKAIKAVKKNNQFLETYYEIIDNVGFVSHSLWLSIIEENKLEFNDPVSRRVLVMELVY